MHRLLSGHPRIFHFEARIFRSHDAAVTDLPTGLGVERRAIQHHDAFLACGQHLDRLAGCVEQLRGLARVGCAFVAEKLDDASRL